MKRAEILKEFFDRVVYPNNRGLLRYRTSWSCAGSLPDGALTGSLALHLQGVDLGREPQDIDIAVFPENVLDNGVSLYIPTEYVKSCDEVDLGGDYLVLGRYFVSYKDLDFKVEILPDEAIHLTSEPLAGTEYCVAPKALILGYKLAYVVGKTDKGGKHKADIQRLLDNAY